MQPPAWLKRARRLLLAPRTALDVGVVEQWIVVLLDRFGECSFRRLEAELSAIRGAPPAEVAAAVLKLEELRVLQRAPQPELMAVERRFQLTAAGRKLRRYIPDEPRSPTIFYV